MSKPIIKSSEIGSILEDRELFIDSFDESEDEEGSVSSTPGPSRLSVDLLAEDNNECLGLLQVNGVSVGPLHQTPGPNPRRSSE